MEAVLIPFALFVSILAGAIWIAVREQEKARSLMATLATRQGLQLIEEKKSTFDARKLSVSGTRGGRAVRFWHFSTGSGKSRQHWIAVGVQPRRTGGLAFQLQGQGFGTKIAEWFGAKEIEVGDPAFDAQWFMRTNRPFLLAAALLPEIRKKLSALRERGAKGRIELEHGEVSYVQLGALSNEKHIALLEDALPVLFDLADAIEACADAAQP